MKSSFRLFAIAFIFLLTLNSTWAQDTDLSEKYKEETIYQLSKLMNDRYVFPEVAKRTEIHLKNQLEHGHFDKYTTDESFAEALTKSVQEVNKDKHMRIRKNRPYEAPENSPERLIEERLYRMDRSRRGNYGFNEVKVLDGNVGYVDLRGFAGLENGKEVADAYMKLVSRTDAVIIDLSKNGGGSPRMVQYLCSYFFNQKTHLNSLYWREGDRTEEFWTLDEVGGDKMSKVPLIIITSNRTFSAAEEFSYNMQAQKRATLVGQTSGGGANPGGSVGINENLTIFIPTGRAINPITETNWEGVGVIPEIETTVEETFEKAYELAKEAAETYRVKTNEKYTKLLMDLYKELDAYANGGSEEEILQRLTVCKEANLLGEFDINVLGYDYLLQHKQPKVALYLFKANTTFYPNSANVFDSYAEALMMNEELESALKNYKIAVDLAVKNKDANTVLFQQNLESLKKKINNHN